MKNRLLITFIACLMLATFSATAGNSVFGGGNDKIEIVITPQTTLADLEQITAQLKSEGIDFKVVNTNYEEGALAEIEFKIDGNGMNGNYSNNDLNVNDKIYLVIDKSKHSLHIGSSPSPKCMGVCSSSCSKVI